MNALNHLLVSSEKVVFRLEVKGVLTRDDENGDIGSPTKKNICATFILFSFVFLPSLFPPVIFGKRKPMSICESNCAQGDKSKNKCRGSGVKKSFHIFHYQLFLMKFSEKVSRFFFYFLTAMFWPFRAFSGQDQVFRKLLLPFRLQSLLYEESFNELETDFFVVFFTR